MKFQHFVPKSAFFSKVQIHKNHNSLKKYHNNFWLLLKRLPLFMLSANSSILFCTTTSLTWPFQAPASKDALVLNVWLWNLSVPPIFIPCHATSNAPKSLYFVLWGRGTIVTKIPWPIPYPPLEVWSAQFQGKMEMKYNLYKFWVAHLKMLSDSNFNHFL